jgi:hypothetical protein
MKKFSSIRIVVITSCLSACMNAKPSIGKLWFYTYSSDSSIDRVSLTPANFLELRPDNTFTSDLGKFHYGHWNLKDQQLFLNAEDGDINIVMINGLNQNEMQIQVGHSSASYFDGLVLPKPEDDPFSRTNNLWRIHAATKETDDQIKKRLRNHCSFWVSYFKWALENEMTTVDVRSTPTPIKIYGNGFSIKPFHELPDIWKSYFYDSSDCRKANDILIDIVQTHNIAWAHTDNKYKMFISAFQQMQQFLK